VLADLGLARSENLIDWVPTGKAVWPGGGREAGANRTEPISNWNGLASAETA
jgi:hypothetical protein